jgi:hypothetical protein
LELIYGLLDCTVTQEFDLIQYTFARILVFAAFLSVFYLIGLRDLVLLAVSILVSGIVSLFVLDKSREAAAEKFLKRFKKTD